MDKSGNFLKINCADAVSPKRQSLCHLQVLNGQSTPTKSIAADLNASVAGVYDLYRKDGNASAGTPVVQAEVADGSVTAKQDCK